MGIPGSFFSLERHSGFFLACLRSFFCLATDAFSILCRRRVVPLLDLGSGLRGRLERGTNGLGFIWEAKRVYILLGLLIVPAIVKSAKHWGFWVGVSVKLEMLLRLSLLRSQKSFSPQRSQKIWVGTFFLPGHAALRPTISVPSLPTQASQVPNPSQI